MARPVKDREGDYSEEVRYLLTVKAALKKDSCIDEDKREEATDLVQRLIVSLMG